MLKLLRSIYYAFPVQLLILHFRSNHLLIGMWIFLFFLIQGDLAPKFGIHYLFLDPEYLGQIDFWSFFFLGLAFGGFFLTWNLTTYLLSAHHFLFLATLFHPFTKFCFNNILLPLAFLVYYVWSIIQFQVAGDEVLWDRVLIYAAGFLVGLLVLVFSFFFYFYHTNRDISYYEREGKRPPNLSKTIRPGRRDVDLDYAKKDEQRWRVDTYWNEFFQVRLVRSVAHYDSKILMRIFRQNHLNALIIQISTIILLMILGLLTDLRIFRLPAGASIFFLLSIITAVLGALTYWLNEWRVTSLIVFLILINILTSFDIGYHDSRAYGMNYQTTPAAYDYARLQSIVRPDTVQKDKQQTIQILERWKEKNWTPGAPLPKMVIISTSGGGLTSASWALRSLVHADSLMEGQLLRQTALITGASGGVLGTAYLRELMLREQEGEVENIYAPQYGRNISRDLLNSVAFMLVANDMTIPWTQFEYEGDRYYRDRGYMFEKQLNENTEGILEKKLADYRAAERAAKIPMLYITPSILNDGRRLYITPQPVSFMMVPPVGVNNPRAVEIDGVDFGRIFGEQEADSLRFLSALRMSATFPYILPNVHLPSRPELEVMDAGYLDNYGLLSAIRFIQVFQEWIRENTDGVILLQIGTSPKYEKIGATDRRGIITSLFSPIEMAGQIFTRQEFEHDNSLGFLYDLLGEDQFEQVRLNYSQTLAESDGRATISFHITEKEKSRIEQSLFSMPNQIAIRRLIRLMNREPEVFTEKLRIPPPDSTQNEK